MHPAQLRAVVLSCSVLATGTAGLAHPDTHEPGLVAHWAAGAHEVEDGRLSDVTHTLSAKVMGQPRMEAVGPTLAAIFDGADDYLLITDKIGAERKGLPTKEISVSAWVNMGSLTQFGSIVGCLQDNGDFEKGWCLGYNDSTFTFALSSTGADDGDGKMTYLAGDTLIQKGRWYHVAGTYDGAKMKIYVNGKLERESAAQSGEILYADDAPYTLACYLDKDEIYPMDGAIHRVKVHNRVISQDEIKAVVEKNSNLVSFAPPADKELTWLVQPYLQAATLNSITVMSETSRPAAMVVEYGRKQPLDLRAEMSEAKAIGEVVLGNLLPATDYFYRVTRTTADGVTIKSDVKALKTNIPADMPWSFGIIGDTQRNPSVTKKCAEIAYGLRPNFMLHCGDVVDDGYSKNQWLKDLFEPMAQLLSHVPMFPTIGNHERNSHFYYDYFSLPSPEYYYTFTFGNAEFFMIDTNKPCGPGSEQWAWLERDLKKSKATWKFTCHHHPCFSSDEDDYGDTKTGIQKKDPGNGEPSTRGDVNARPLVKLYEQYGVDIAFNGHIHVYERTWPILDMKINQAKGIRYITSGGGGGGLEHPAPNKAWFSLHVNRTHHVCYVAIHDRTIEFKAYDIEGRLFDTFQLTKPEGR